MFSDVRLAIRALSRKPGFTLVAALTFALGIGATTAIFTLIEGVLLRPWVTRTRSRLYAVTASDPSQNVERRGNYLPDFWFFRENARSFEELAFYGWRSMTLEEPGSVQQIRTVVVSANLFRMLGVAPALGRQLEAEDEMPGRGRVALVSHGFWERLFGSDPSILGRTIRIDGVPIQIVGVMPMETSLPSPQAELWLPVGYLEAYAESEFGREERDFTIVGRLAEGVDPAAASLRASKSQPRRSRSRFPRPTPAGRSSFSRSAISSWEAPSFLSGWRSPRSRPSCSSPAPTSRTWSWSGVSGASARWRCAARSAPGAGASCANRWSRAWFSRSSAEPPESLSPTVSRELILALEPGVFRGKTGSSSVSPRRSSFSRCAAITGIGFGSISALGATRRIRRGAPRERRRDRRALLRPARVGGSSLPASSLSLSRFSSAAGSLFTTLGGLSRDRPRLRAERRLLFPHHSR